MLSDAHRSSLRVADSAGLFRNVELCCAGQVWVFAETVIPDSTLCAYPWLAELGDASLGEFLSELSGVERSSYEYAWVPAEDPLSARALRGAEIAPAGLWARRSRIQFRGVPLLSHEVFLPSGPHRARRLRAARVRLPRSGPELMERIAPRWRWFAYRVRFHPWTTNELPGILATLEDYIQLMRLEPPDRHLALALADVMGGVDRRTRQARPAPIPDLRRGHGDHAIRRLCDQRLRGSQLRPARRAHAGAPARGRTHHHRRGVDPVRGAVACRAAARAAAEQSLCCGRRRRVSRGDLSVRQAIPARAAALSGSRLRAGEFRWRSRRSSSHIPRVAWLFLLANVLWVTVYDTIYAMVDRDDDIKIGVRSTAILFGDSDRHIIAVLQAMTLVALYLAGRMLRMTGWYYAGLIAGAVFFVYQLWLIRNRDRDACFRAFLNNNYVGMAMFIGILLTYQFRP